VIYFLRNPNTGLVKIGTTGNYHLRLSQLIAEHGDLELLGLMDGSRLDEQALHQRFIDDHDHHEWFRVSAAITDFVKMSTHMCVPNKGKQIERFRRVPVTPEIHTELQDFAYGLGVTFDDAIRVLLLEVADNEDRLSVGRRLRTKYQAILKPQSKSKSKSNPN